MKKALALLSVAVFLVSACGGSKKSAKSSYRKGGSSTRYYPDGRYRSLDDVIYENLEHQSGSGIHYSSHLKIDPKFDIPYTYNQYVEKWIDYFTGKGRRHYARYLARLGRFMPYIHSVADQYGVPRDLVFLSMIESGFNLRAKSWASAVGPWQFIRSTGAMYGLNADYYVDERRSIEKATHAALRHLRDLYQQFGHWYLAFAAYNAGAGKVSRAIQKHGTDFWDMVQGRYLRQETKDYVPKIIAAAIIAKNPSKYGFRNIRYQTPVAFEIVKLKGPTDLEVAAECSGVDPDLIRLLNPELLQDLTPPHIPNYRLKIPHGTKGRFNKRYASLSPSQRVRIHYYTTDRGDTVKSVAQHWGVSEKSLVEANRGKIDVSKRRVSKKVKVRVGRKKKRRYKYKTKNYTVASYSVTPGTRLTIPSSRSLKSYSSSRDDAAAYRAQSRYGMRVASSEESSKKKKKKKKKEQESEKVVRNQKPAPQPDLEPLPVAQNSPAKSDLDIEELASSETRTTGGPTSFDSLPGGQEPTAPSNEELRAAVAKLPAKGDLGDEEDETPRKKWSPENEVTAKYHVVKRGETLNLIAKKYGVSRSMLKAWNGSKVYPVLKSGMKIQVGGEPAVAKAAPKEKKTEFYTVKSGDTLGEIAKRYGVQRDTLIDWNGKKVSPVLQRGALIRVSGGSKVASSKTASPKASKGSYYKVRPGDTLSGIAKQHGTSVAKLKSLNGSKVSPVLKTGVKIQVRGSKVVKYTVKPGDSLHKIAKKHSTTAAQIKKLNGLKKDVIAPGAILIVRRK